MFNLFLILPFLFSCRTAEKIKYVEEKRMEPVFEKVITDVEDVNSDYGRIAPQSMEYFLQKVGYSRKNRKKCHKITPSNSDKSNEWDIFIDKENEIYNILKDADRFYGKDGEGCYIFNSDKEVNKLIETFNGVDIEFDFFNNKYKLFHFKKDEKNIYFPEIIVKSDKPKNSARPKDYYCLSVLVYAFDFKFNTYNKVFKVDRYTFKDKNFRIRKFRDNNGMLIFMYGDNKCKTDETPFTYKNAFHNPKMFFRVTDILINKGFIDYSTKECECGGIYTSFGIASLKDYECNFIDLFEEGIDVKINHYINQVYNMQDLFFDEYEKSPLMDWYKDKCFDISFLAIEMFEKINDAFFYKYSVNMFNEKEVSESKKAMEDKSDKIVNSYESSIKAIFNILNSAKRKLLLSNEHRYFKDGKILNNPDCPKVDDIIDEVIRELPENVISFKSDLIKIIKMFYEVMKGPEL